MLHVVVIDDDQIVLDSTSLALEAMGHRVTTLTSAADATTIVGREKPDVVLVDLQLPILSGEEWLRRATEEKLGEQAVFAILSSGGVDVLERLVRETCAVGYIRKQDGLEAFGAAFEKIAQEISG